MSTATAEPDTQTDEYDQEPVTTRRARAGLPPADPEPSNLTAALAAFQAELPKVGKDQTAQVRSDKGNYQYRYADLSEISAVVLPALGRHGMAWSTRPTITHAGAFVLHYCLAHISGETIEGEYPIGDPRSGAQALGSNLTYARRYSLCAVTGVAPGGDDDDAAEANDRHRRRAELALQEQEEARERKREQARQQAGEETRRRQDAARMTREAQSNPAPAPKADPVAEPTGSAKAALDLLRQSCQENGWDLDRVAALYAAEHDGRSVKAGTMREIESFRKGLFDRSDSELKPGGGPTGEPAQEPPVEEPPGDDQ